MTLLSLGDASRFEVIRGSPAGDTSLSARDVTFGEGAVGNQVEL
jgi:hypothetical protein